MSGRIRPPDPRFVEGLPPRVGPYSSARATRILLHCYLRDAATVLDLTYAAGRCWSRPLPPGLTVLTNNWDPAAATDYHLDFRDTGLPDRSVPAAVWDPPHLDDLGADSFMRQRYGTVAGAGALRDLITAGAAEAWRICSVGLIVKVLDGPHGGRFQQLTRWVEAAIGVQPCGDLTTTRERPSPRPAVKSLAESMAEVGLLSPIAVFPVGEAYELIAGRHRIEAAKLLGWTEIEAVLLDLDDVQREMAEIDENLVRYSLNAADTARQTARRKELYLKLHPETARGVAGARAKHGSASAESAFAADTAAKTGRSVRSVQVDAQIGESIALGAGHRVGGEGRNTRRALGPDDATEAC